MIACVLVSALVTTAPARANGVQPHAAKQHITVKTGDLSLQRAFELIERQTRLLFAYDEYEIDLSRKLNLKTGHVPLSDLLDMISSQTGYQFTQVKNTILVSSAAPAAPTPPTALAPPVKGLVTDAAGKQLPGATILVKGTKISTQTTTIDGRFSIEAPADAVLIISYIGYTTQEVAINGRLELTVSVQENRTGLNEVIVVGYQTQKRSAIAGAVTVVNVDDVAKIPVGFADQALQGQASGVRITQTTGQPGDGLALHIHQGSVRSVSITMTRSISSMESRHKTGSISWRRMISPV